MKRALLAGVAALGFLVGAGIPTPLQPDGTTIISNGPIISCATATTSQIGCVKPDGATININGAGVISSSGGSATSVTVGTTTVGGGTSGNFLYDNAGVLGQAVIGSGLSFSGGTLTATGGGGGTITGVTAGTGLSGGGTSGTVTVNLSSPVSPTLGGTGVNNGSNTVTLGGPLVTSGAYTSTFTFTGATGVTFPTSGTLDTTAARASALTSAIPSASGQLLGGSGTAGTASGVTVGSGLTLSGGTLTATGGGSGTITGVTAGTGLTGGGTSGAVTVSLASLAANQLLGSLTAVAPSGLSVPSCSGGSNALIWTSGTGFGCNTITGGSATSITVGTTTIGSGTSGSLLYDNAGTLGNETLASLLAAPPAIGGTTPAAGAFSTLTKGGVNVPIIGTISGTARDAALAVAAETAALSRTATGSVSSRTVAAAAADVFNAKDYGALGSGTATTIGTTYGSSLSAVAAYTTTAGATPFSWMTSSTYGLTFPMNTSAAQGSAGTTLTFSVALSGINGWSQSAPQFNGFWPANQQYLVQSGMTVSGSCIAGGTTVASTAAANNSAKLTSVAQGSAGTTLTFLDTTGLVVGQPVTGTSIPGSATIASKTATTVTLSASTTAAVVAQAVIQFGEIANITLSASTSSACASGTTITFTLSNSQVQALTVDYVALQSAYAAASANGGGEVVVPAGIYELNRPVWNPGITNASAMSPGIVIRGAGTYATELAMTTDLGPGACTLGESNRGSSSTGYAEYSDLRLLGPGTANTIGAAVAGMDGLCIGAKAKVARVSTWLFNAGLNVLRDHQIIEDSDFDNNFYGVYLAPNGDTVGNQRLARIAAIGEARAGIVTAWNNGIVSSTLSDSDVGGNSPFSFYQEPLPYGQSTLPISFLGYSIVSNVLGENVGDAYLYSESGGTISNNSFIGGQPVVQLTSSSSYKLPGVTARAAVYAGNFLYNNMLNADFSNGGANFTLVSTAIFELTGAMQGNQLGDQTPMLTNLSATIPAITTDDGNGNSAFNRFVMGRATGTFRAVEAAVTAGEILTYGTIYAYNGARPMAAGYQPLGVALTAASIYGLTPVVEAGYAPVAKTTGTAIANGAPVCVSSATVTAVTVCTPGQPVIGSDVDGATGATSGATTALVDLKLVFGPALATTSAAGLVKPDGSTITISGGVISAAGGGSGIPAASGELLGGSGTAGTASAIAVGSGLTLSGGTLSATGGSSSNPAIDLVTSGVSNTYSGTTSAYIKWTSSSTASKAQTIPACASGLSGVMLVVKDGVGSAGTAGEGIIITPASGTIDGQATLTISSNYGAARVFCDGSTADWSTY